MIHYVDNLEVIPIKISGIDTATFAPRQRTLCGIEIRVKNRSEFATQVKGMCDIDCPDCLSKIREPMKPITCSNCQKVFDLIDIQNISCMDEEMTCKTCKTLKNA